MSQKKAKAERKAEKKSSEINTQEAQAAIKKDRDERINKGGAEIEATLKRYNLSLDAIMICTRRGNIPEIKILAKD